MSEILNQVIVVQIVSDFQGCSDVVLRASVKEFRTFHPIHFYSSAYYTV